MLGFVHYRHQIAYSTGHPGISGTRYMKVALWALPPLSPLAPQVVWSISRSPLLAEGCALAPRPIGCSLGSAAVLLSVSRQQSLGEGTEVTHHHCSRVESKPIPVSQI